MFEMKVYSGLVVYTGTWLVLVVLFIYYVRISRPNAYHYVDQRIIKQTVITLDANRVDTHNTFIETEIAELRRGRKLPVLDSWKTDAQLALRHSFFPRIAHLAIDPQQKEMEMLIQLPAIKTADVHISRVQLFFRISEFLKIAAGDPRLVLYKEFFSTIIVECDIQREDDRGYDIPVSVFSMELPAGRLWELAAFSPFQHVALDRISDIRFSDGGQIEPHRIMLT
jgi:hypothetical protein